MAEYEQRISTLEKEITTKCNEQEIRNIVKDEIKIIKSNSAEAGPVISIW